MVKVYTFGLLDAMQEYDIHTDYYYYYYYYTGTQICIAPIRHANQKR